MSNPYTGNSNQQDIPGLTGINSAAGGTGVSGTGDTGVSGASTDTTPAGAGVSGTGATGVMGASTVCCFTDPDDGGSLGFTGPGGQFFGFSAPSTGAGISGSSGVESWGGSGDSTTASFAGSGVEGNGGFAGPGGFDGPGGFFWGGGLSRASSGDGVVGWAGSGFAGNFHGNVLISGVLIASAKYFKIDHPLDPANKNLVHASVESSEMMNIYTGNVTTDGQGQATVQLPEWFEVLNTDFRYQLTVMGQFAQAMVSRKIEKSRFEIKTSAPSVEVSWQVTGVRQDAYAKANPLAVEQEKEDRLRGFYIHPELHGQPPEKHIEHARHPHIMKRMKSQRAKLEEKHAKRQ